MYRLHGARACRPEGPPEVISKLKALMDGSVRMRTMFACLVLATSGTATLLAWMEPLQAAAPFGCVPDETLRLARRTVSEDVFVRKDIWLDIELAPATASLQHAFTAASPSAGWHFNVDSNGRPSRGRAWQTQWAAGDAPRTVRISISTPGRGNEMSQAQWQSVRALIAALAETLGSETAPMPVHLDHDWAQFYNLASISFPLGPMASKPS